MSTASEKVESELHAVCKQRGWQILYPLAPGCPPSCFPPDDQVHRAIALQRDRLLKEWDEDGRRFAKKLRIPANLRLPPSLAQGADPGKLARQIAKHGKSLDGMPPLQVVRGKDGRPWCESRRTHGCAVKVVKTRDAAKAGYRGWNRL